MRLPNLLAMDTKTRGQSPSFFNGHPFWEHLVACAIRAWHRIDPVAISLSGRVVAGPCMITFAPVSS